MSAPGSDVIILMGDGTMLPQIAVDGGDAPTNGQPSTYELQHTRIVQDDGDLLGVIAPPALLEYGTFIAVQGARNGATEARVTAVELSFGIQNVSCDIIVTPVGGGG
jgi:hypothetical protein